MKATTSAAAMQRGGQALCQAVIAQGVEVGEHGERGCKNASQTTAPCENTKLQTPLASHDLAASNDNRISADHCASHEASIAPYNASHDTTIPPNSAQSSDKIDSTVPVVAALHDTTIPSDPTAAGADSAPDMSRPPRRAQTALNYYSSTARRRLRKEGWTEEQMKEKVQEGWAALPEAERQQFEAKAEADKQRYKAHMAAYLAAGGAPPAGLKDAGGERGGGFKGGKIPSTPVLQKVNLALLGVSPSMLPAGSTASNPTSGNSKGQKTPASSKG